MEKVVAVVVTYNRRALLRNCINALRQQTRRPDAILVVNNGSTDDTEAWLETQPDLTFITQANNGSGGGFHTGIAWGFQQRFSWIWCMDDDGMPAPNALEAILAPQLDTLALRNCAVININNRHSFVWKTKHYQHIDEVKDTIVEGIGHPFNGTLIHRRIIERVGLPSENLFLWGDESEYFYRITRKNRIPVYTIGNSIHYHPKAAFTYKQDWNFSDNWKMYYYVRNRLHIYRSKYSNHLVAMFQYLVFLAGMATVIVLHQRTNKWKKLGFITWPALDALKNSFKATPQSILSIIGNPKAHSFRKQLANELRDAIGVVLFPFSPFRHKTGNA